MSWLKVDDKMCRHPKIVGLSDAAFRLHMAGLGHCAEYETDGRVTFAAVEGLTRHRNKDKLTEELVQAGLWKPASGGFVIHDYLEYNPSHAELKAKRDAAKERVRQNRARYVHTNGAAGSREHLTNGLESSVQPAEASRAHARVRAHAGRAGLGSGSQQDLPEGNGAKPADDEDPFEADLPEFIALSARELAIVEEIRRHPALERLDAAAVAKSYESATMTAPKPIPWVLQAIRDYVGKHDAAALQPEALRRGLGGFMLHARAPRDRNGVAAPKPAVNTPHDQEAAEVQRREREAAARLLAQRQAQRPTDQDPDDKGDPDA